MAEVVGEAVIKLKADLKELEKGLNKAQNQATNAGSKIATAVGAGVKVAAVATVTAAIGVTKKLSEQAIELYGTYEQTLGGVKTLFGDAAETVIKNSEQAYINAGLSANDYMEQAVTFSATLIRNLNGDTQRAAELTDMAIQDMADNVNKLGTDMAMVQNAYAGLARGNATMLDNLRLGYAGTQKEALQLAKDMGVVGDEVESFADLGFDKSIEAIHELQVQLGITGATAEEAAGTIQGSQKAFKAAAEDFIRGMADPAANMNELFDNLISTAVTFSKQLIATLLRALPNIAKGIAKLVQAIGDLLPTILPEIIPAFTEAVVEVIGSLIELAPVILEASIQAISGIIIGIAQALPSLMASIVKAIMEIVNVLLEPENLKAMTWAFFELLLGIVRAIPEIVKAFNEALPEMLDTFVRLLTDPDSLKMLFEAGVQLFMALVEAVPAIVGSLIEAWKNCFAQLWESLKQVFVNFSAEFGAGVSNAIIGGLNKMIGFTETVLNAPINAINAALDAINTIPGVEIQHIANIQFNRIPEVAMATGGIVTRPTTALIGEAGPEAVIPLHNNTDWAKAIAGALNEEFMSDELSGGRTVNVYMTNQINNKLDINEVSRELVTSIRRAI